MHPNPTIRRIALVAATALVAGAAAITSAAPAHAAATVGIQGPTVVSLDQAAVSADFTVTLSGTPTDYVATVQAVKTVGAASALPTIASKPALAVDQPLTVSLNLPNTTAPGRYQLTVVALEGSVLASTAVATFDVNASLTSTASLITTGTIYYHYGKSKIKVVWAGPLYLKGAKISFYYQKPGKTAFTKIGSKKISSKGKATFKTKKVRVVSGAAYQVRVSARPFAPAIVISNSLGQS